jgi:hypothetical protein
MTPSFRNPGRSFQLMDIAIDLAAIDPGTLLGMAIHYGLKERKVMATIEMIKDQYRDAPQRTIDIVGYKILDKIQNLSVTIKT